MNCRHAIPVFCLFIVAALVPLVASAQWQPDGVPICTATDDQEEPAIVADGSGGTIIAWQDFRNGGPRIFARKVNGIGVPQWTPDGVVLDTVTSTQIAPVAVADGSGGAIVAWLDDRNGFSAHDIYVQRIDMSGAVQWTDDGVAVCTETTEQRGVVIVSDNAGGAIIAWRDARTGSPRIYAQRVNASGDPQWMANGVVVSTVLGDQEEVTIAPDGTGGAILAWLQGLIPPTVYAQRLSSTGVPQWTTDGKLLYGSLSSGPAIVADGAGGAIVAWRTGLSGAMHIWSQRIDAAGVGQWVGGIDVAPSGDAPGLVPDGSGGAIVTWLHAAEEDSFYISPDIHAQRLSTAGAKQWPDNDAVTSADGRQDHVVAAPDGAGGAIISWEDNRNGTVDIYAQRMNGTGAPAWTLDGVEVCTSINDQEEPAIVGVGVGTAVIAWHDKRGGARRDIYAQQVTTPPNAVAITYFGARERNGVVELQAAFRSDLGVEAVNVYRAPGVSGGAFTRIDRVDDVQGERFEHVDRQVVAGNTYRYTIGVIDADGEFFSPNVTITVQGVAGWLGQNEPNPFNPTTTILFVLPSREHVTLAVYAPDGRLVRTLVDEIRAQGQSEAVWDGRDDQNVAVSSGVYFYQIRAGKFIESRKMLLLK